MSFFDKFQVLDKPRENAILEDSRIQEVPQEPIENNNDYFSKFYEIKEPEKEKSFGEKAVLGAQKLVARGLEATMGLPGNIEAMVRPFVREHQQGEGGLIGKLSEKRVLPTTSELREMSKEAYQGKLEPEGKIEKNLGDIAEDYIFQPGGPLKKIILTLGGKAVEESMKLFGASDDAASKGKAVSTFFGSLFGKKNVKDYYKKEYELASSAIPNGAKVNANIMSGRLGHLETQINKGVHTTAKDPALKVINDLKKKISKSEIGVDELDRAYHDINTILLDKKNLAPTAEKWLLESKDIVKEQLEKYGKANPEYIKSFKNANAAFAGLANGQKATQSINKWKKSGIISGPPALAAELYFMGPEATAATIGVLGTAYGAASLYDLTTRIFANPTLFKYYSKAAAAAASENSAQFVNNITKLDKRLKESKPDTSKFVDLYRKSKGQNG